MNINKGTKVKLKLSRNSISDIKADLISCHSDREFSNATYGKLLEAIENPETEWMFCCRDAYHSEVVFVSLTKRGFQIPVDESEIVIP